MSPPDFGFAAQPPYARHPAQRRCDERPTWAWLCWTLGLMFAATAPRMSAADGIRWDAINFAASAVAGTNLLVTADVTNTGDTVWDSTCVLELKDGAGNRVSAPPITGIPPGGSTTASFFLTLPAGSNATYRYGLTAHRQDVAYFGETQWRDVTLTAAPGEVFPPPGSVWLSSYRYMEIFKPTIDTNWATSPYYRLRAKFPGFNNGLGFHAATRFNNKGLELDALPPPGTYYPVTLYWLRFEGADGYNLLQQGPGNNQTVVITEPSVLLSGFWFSASERPHVSINQNLPKNYRLVVRVVQSGEQFALSWNNDTRLLDHIPGPGTYAIQTYWQRYAPDGVTVEASGTPVTRELTVVDGPNQVFTANGQLYSQDNFDESGNFVGTGSTLDVYQIYVPYGGTLRVTGTGFAREHYTELSGPSGYPAVDASPWSPSVIDRSWTVTPGVYRLDMWGDYDPGQYEIVGTLTPPSGAGAPVVTTASLPPAAVGVPYSAQMATTGWTTSYYAGGLPLGLTCNSATGQISGTPLQAGTFNEIYLHAANGTLHGPDTLLTLAVAKGSQAITFAAPANKLSTDAPFEISAVASSGLPVSFAVMSGPATLAGNVVSLAGSAGTVVLRATQAGNPNYEAAAAVDRTIVVAASPPPPPPPPPSTPPVITAQPGGQTAVGGLTVTFSVVATGNPAPTYQWRKGGTPLVNGGAVSGANAATLTLTPATLADAGNYDVVVSNSAGAATSNPASLVMVGNVGAPLATAATEVTASYFTANWSVVGGASGYRLDVSTSPTFAVGAFVAPYQNLLVGAQPFAVVTGLTANLTYHFRVRAVDATGASLSSNTVSVTTAASAGTQPQLNTHLPSP